MTVGTKSWLFNSSEVTIGKLARSVVFLPKMNTLIHITSNAEVRFRRTSACCGNVVLVFLNYGKIVQVADVIHVSC
jgi:hypothetical protein